MIKNLGSLFIMLNLMIYYLYISLKYRYYINIENKIFFQIINNLLIILIIGIYFLKLIK